MRRILVRWLINAIALYVAIYVLGDTRIGYDGGWGGLFTMAAIIGLVNAVIGPFLKFLSCPLIILTLGLFTLIINAVRRNPIPCRQLRVRFSSLPDHLGGQYPAHAAHRRTGQEKALVHDSIEPMPARSHCYLFPRLAIWPFAIL